MLTAGQIFYLNVVFLTMSLSEHATTLLVYNVEQVLLCLDTEQLPDTNFHVSYQ